MVLGTRGSKLALCQSEWFQSKVQEVAPEVRVLLRKIQTSGDKIVDVPLAKIGGKGLFVKEIEDALLAGEIDFAVHSLKDLQTEQPEGLTIGAVCERELPNDVLISKKFSNMTNLPPGASVATGSLRRRSQLLNIRPDLSIVEIRGNVPTRLEKYLRSDLDGMILAYAGIHRLQLNSDMCHLIPIDTMLPAVGQGAVAVEVRQGDKQMLEMASALDHKVTRSCVTAEREFLRQLEGGCQVPIGAIASVEGEMIRLEGMVSSLDGSVIYRKAIEGKCEEADQVGRDLAQTLIGLGAERLLEEARGATGGTAGAPL